MYRSACFATRAALLSRYALIHHYSPPHALHFIRGGRFMSVVLWYHFYWINSKAVAPSSTWNSITHLLVQLKNDPLIGHHCGHWTPPTEEDRIRISLSDLKSSGWDVDDLLLLLHLRRWHTFKHPTGNLWNSGLLCRLYLFFCIFTLFSSVISI